jgi:hypothetical protein
MILIAYYIGLLLVADVATVLLCLWIETIWAAASMPIFIALYFLNLWVCWVVAVRLTEPAKAPERQPAQ